MICKHCGLAIRPHSVLRDTWVDDDGWSSCVISPEVHEPTDL